MAAKSVSDRSSFLLKTIKAARHYLYIKINGCAGRRAPRRCALAPANTHIRTTPQTKIDCHVGFLLWAIIWWVIISVYVTIRMEGGRKYLNLDPKHRERRGKLIIKQALRPIGAWKCNLALLRNHNRPTGQQTLWGEVTYPQNIYFFAVKLQTGRGNGAHYLFFNIFAKTHRNHFM